MKPFIPAQTVSFSVKSGEFTLEPYFAERFTTTISWRLWDDQGSLVVDRLHSADLDLAKMLAEVYLSGYRRLGPQEPDTA